MLPAGMVHLSLYANNFSGSLYLTKLPREMQFLSVGENSFCKFDGASANDAIS